MKTKTNLKAVEVKESRNRLLYDEINLRLGRANAVLDVLYICGAHKLAGEVSSDTLTDLTSLGMDQIRGIEKLLDDHLCD